MPVSRDEQLEDLRRLGTGKWLFWAKPVAILVAAGLAVAGGLSGLPAFYGAAGIAALVALGVTISTSHLQNAARGVAEGIRQDATVDIRLIPWPDGEEKHESYSGIISMDRQPLWQMDFAQPKGWMPQIGLYPAQIAFIGGVEWPVLVILEQGILYPAHKPGRADRG